MIRILTDSASDILPAEAAQLGVDVIPLNVTLEDGTVIRDGVDLTPSDIVGSIDNFEAEFLCKCLVGKPGFLFLRP